MDFETVNPAIPRFRGMHPFDHIPFQWSVHVQREPGAEPEHFDFLALNANDPRSNFAASLCDVLGRSGNIVVYNMVFESGRLSELAGWLPEFAERIKNVQSRLWDLLPFVRKFVYHPAFAGSYSLKAVLPALDPHRLTRKWRLRTGRTQDWLGNPLQRAAWIKRNSNGSGGRC
jgi:hypothetical protein